MPTTFAIDCSTNEKVPNQINRGDGTKPYDSISYVRTVALFPLHISEEMSR